ncbi:hypothetical protein LZ016_03515 [Sphingomonas sp. SM33]|uniref:Uncharacterized protein n=1 Tax=Sphingomonas telluris TaxID=2907998 RepID=A0ABS9VJL6_9SPHN|nr:hypothetical protein [Sphingomonas telluris]MCH8615171.1 hypothetical protein [Sphingomonas telluris]
MSTSLIISLVAVVIALLVVVIASQRSGPRVTTIETRRETEDQKSGTDA